MELLTINDLPQDKIVNFFKEHWGSTEIVTSSGIYDCCKLNGFALLNNRAQIIGLITYVISSEECEIISLNSIEENKGIGTSLIQAVEEIALDNKCKRVKLITTNDNMLALKFYQRRRYVLAELLRDAVDEARKLKPEIPLIGNDGIPIRDELILEKILSFESV